MPSSLMPMPDDGDAWVNCSSILLKHGVHDPQPEPHARHTAKRLVHSLSAVRCKGQPLAEAVHDVRS